MTLRTCWDQRRGEKGGPERWAGHLLSNSMNGMAGENEDEEEENGDEEGENEEEEENEDEEGENEEEENQDEVEENAEERGLRKEMVLGRKGAC